MTKSATEAVQITTLPNGIRVVTESVPYVQSASVGLWVGIGSRDEDEPTRGISHFIEHMMFKGTKNRTAHSIADEIESKGGSLNAFTDKEATCYQTRVLAEHVGLSMDILTDMMRHSLFDAEEMEREKRVVLEEIKMYEDSPEDRVHEVFEQTLFPAHPIGKSIIGTSRTVSSITRDDIVGYIENRYRPDRIVVSAAGNLEHDEVVKITQDMMGDLSGAAPSRKMRQPKASGKSKQIRKRDIEQVHFVLGTSGYSKMEKQKYALSILNNVLGGNMSSRLFQEIREKRGLAYSIGSYSRSYQDGGMFAVYGGTSPDTYEQVLELTRKEFASVRNSGLTKDELTKAKTQVRGAVVLGLESMNARMNRYGESLLSYGRIIPITEVLERYDAVDAAAIAEVAALVLDESKMTLSAIGAFPRTKADTASDTIVVEEA